MYETTWKRRGTGTSASPGAVVAWRKAYKKKGEAGLAAKPHPGRKPKLSIVQRKKLIRFLKKGPQAHGYKTDLWTLPRVAEVIHKRFGVRYDPSHVWRILDALGWSAQKPERRAEPVSATSSASLVGPRRIGCV